MTFIVSLMVRKGIRSDDAVSGFVKKHIDICFQNKLVFRKSVFLMDMYGVSAFTKRHEKFKVAPNVAKVEDAADLRRRG